jgi:hypothetical protein
MIGRKMKLNDLADLVIVRNHILTVLNDKSATTKEEFRPLNAMRILLDKQFVKEVQDLNFDEPVEESVPSKPARNAIKKIKNDDTSA